MKFNSSELCASWQSKVSYESHADYAGTNKRVHALCNNMALVLKLNEDSDSNKSPIGAIVGGVVGVLAVGAIVAVVVLVLKKKRRFAFSSTSPDSPDTEVL